MDSLDVKRVRVAPLELVAVVERPVEKALATVAMLA